MRVMVFVKATADSEAGIMPSAELFEAMGKFNEELIKAGIMKDGDGLKPSSMGKRVLFDGPSRVVTDGPYVEVKDMVLGFIVISARDLAHAIELASPCPMLDGGTVEVRPVDALQAGGLERLPQARRRRDA